MSRLQFIIQLITLHTFFMVGSYVLIPIPHIYAMIPLSIIGLLVSTAIIAIEQSLSKNRIEG